MKFAFSALALVITLVAASACDAQRYPGWGYGYGPGMMGNGYGPGRGMMGGYDRGPGMMGGFGMGGMMSARNQACNQDGSVPDFGFRRSAGASDLSVDDIRNRLDSAIAWNGNPNLKLGALRKNNPNTVSADIVTKDNSLVERLVFDRRSGTSCVDLAAK